MSLLNEILNSQNGAVIGQLASQFGLGQGDTQKALGALLPHLTAGVQRNKEKSGGAEALLAALSKGKHSQYLDDLQALQGGQATSEGNKILGHLFGSKDVSRAVASEVGGKTGMDSTLIKQMLPVVASLFMGSMSKKAGSAGLLGALSQGGGASSSQLSGLSALLDQDGDGSIADDVLNIASKFFK